MLKRLEGHTAWVDAIVFSPDGSLALSCSREETILWNLRTGKVQQQLGGRYNPSSQLAFSPDGKTIVAGHYLALWDAQTGKKIRDYNIPGKGKYTNISNFALFPKGNQLIAGKDSSLFIWDTQTGSLVKEINIHVKNIRFITVSPDEQTVYCVGGSGNKLLAWDINKGTPQKNIVDPEDVSFLSFSANGRYMLIKSRTGLDVWEVKNSTLIRHLAGWDSFILSAMFSTDSRYVLSASNSNEEVLIQEVTTGNVIQRFRGYRQYVKPMAYSRVNYSVLLANRNGMSLWMLQTNESIRLLQKKYSDFLCIDSSPDGHFALAGAASSKKAFLFDLNQNKLTHELVGHTSYIQVVRFLADNRYAITGSYDKTMILWDTQTAQQIRRFTGHTEPILSLAITPDGRYLLSGSVNELFLWDINTGKINKRLSEKVGAQSITISLDGRFALTNLGGKPVLKWELSNGSMLKNFLISDSHYGVSSVSYSPDGNYVVSTIYETGKTIFWDPETGVVQQSFDGLVETNSLPVLDERLLITRRGYEILVSDSQTGKHLATKFYINDTDWVVTTPTGLFDASPGALKLMHYVVNDSTDHDEPWKVIDLEQLKHRYYQPGLLPILMGFSKEPLRQVPAFEGVALPPSVQLAISQDTLHLSLQNRKGGIGKVSVFINEAEVVEDVRPNPARDSTQTTLTLHLPLSRFASRFDTLNTIRVVAFNGQGWISSRPEEISYRPAAQARGGKVEGAATVPERDTVRLRAVIVGTSNVGLRFAHTDARQIANGLRLAANELLGQPNVNVQLLTTQPTGAPTAGTSATGASAGKDDIVKALEAAQSLRPQDIFMLYLAGHGINYGGQDGDFYYLTAGATSADATYLNDPAIRQTYALSSAELTHYLNLIPARKKLLILDVCAAGKGADKLLVAARDIPPSQIRALDQLQSRTGFYVLAGSAADAVSYESNVYGQGLLTYALLQGMRGGKLRREGDNEYLDVEQWLGYAVEQVPLLAKEVRGIQQPFYRGLDTDKSDNHRSFDVGKITPAIKAQIRIAQPRPVLLVKSFQDETQFDDVLALTPTIESELIDLSARGADAPMLYMEAKDYPGAYALVGRYTVKDEAVQIKCKVMRATAQVGEFVVTGQKSKLAELAKLVLARAQGLVKQ